MFPYTELYRTESASHLRASRPRDTYFKLGVGMATPGAFAVQVGDPIAGRYEALIRIANSVRAQKDAEDGLVFYAYQTRRGAH